MTLNGAAGGHSKLPKLGRLGITPLLFALLLLPSLAKAMDPKVADIRRFVYSGDGRIRLISEKNGQSYTGQYRSGQGRYDSKALKMIHAVFGAPYDPGQLRLSLRFIEFLDYLEGQLRPGALITLTSGYRSPEYNQNLRHKGALAAKASLHQYGMAADLKMDGVPAKQIWEYVKAMEFGGAGYYHGQTVHLDVGPARYWDQATSGVGTGISDDNKLIGIITEYDRYQPGETITLQFIRMTAFPIGVNPEFELVAQSGVDPSDAAVAFTPRFTPPHQGPCPSFDSIDQLDGIRWQLPPSLPPGPYTIRARFCNNPWDKMPRTIATPEFVVLAP